MDFARFPWAQTEQSEEGFEIEIRDLRFATSNGGGGFLADIKMDSALQVRSESFTFRAPAIRAEER
jgi:hypothetical protein